MKNKAKKAFFITIMTACVFILGEIKLLASDKVTSQCRDPIKMIVDFNNVIIDCGDSRKVQLNNIDEAIDYLAKIQNNGRIEIKALRKLGGVKIESIINKVRSKFYTIVSFYVPSSDMSGYVDIISRYEPKK